MNKAFSGRSWNLPLVDFATGGFCLWVRPPELSAVPYCGGCCLFLCKHRAGPGLPQGVLPGWNWGRLWSHLSLAQRKGIKIIQLIKEGSLISRDVGNTSTSEETEVRENWSLQVQKDVHVPREIFWVNLWSCIKKICWGNRDVTLWKLAIN